MTVLAVALTFPPPRAAGQGVMKVSIAQAQDVFDFAPAYIARAKFFKEMGVDAQFEILAGGGPVFASVSGGSTSFGLSAPVDLINFASQGEDFTAIVGLNYETVELVVNKEWAQSKGVSRFSPLKARILALRGAVIGATSPGALSDTLAQYLLRWAGLEPGKDAQIIPIGGISVRLAALQANRIQATISSPPAGPLAEKEGYGFVLIPAKDLPGIKRQLNETLFARKSWLLRNREAARRAATAIALADNFLLDNFEESVKLIEQFFPRLTRDVLEASIRSVRPQTIRNGVMKAEDWEKTVELLITIGRLKDRVSTREGLYWTNQYIDLARLK